MPLPRFTFAVSATACSATAISTALSTTMLSTAALILAAGLSSACSSDGAKSDPGEGGANSQTSDSTGGGTGIQVNGNEDEVICDSDSGDNDGDGFTVEDGDCNDCDVNANPGALDVSGNEVDEDCNGLIDDDIHLLCDSDLEFNSNDPTDAARAIGLCKTADPKRGSWGLLEAKYTLADGTVIDHAVTPAPNPIQHGILDDYGDNLSPREGKKLLALSTGEARDTADPGFAITPNRGFNTTVSAPSGFPVQSTSCNTTIDDDDHANDSIAFEVTFKAPSNAHSLSFDFDFYTAEYPEYVCNAFNDNFIVLMDPAPASAENGNISFDAEGNAVNVNAGFLQVCTPADPADAGGKTFTCPLGNDELAGTPYVADDTLTIPRPEGAATGWLNTTVPIEPGAEITLKFMTWDAGVYDNAGTLTLDNVRDATVLIDNLTFSAEEATAATTTPVTR